MKRYILILGAITPVICAAFLSLLWYLIVPGDAHGQSPTYQNKAVSASIQVTPTVDSTVTALQKEQLKQQVNKLTTDNSWEVWTLLSPSLTVLLGVLAGVGSFWRWRRDRLDEQERRAEDQRLEQRKRAEERFQTTVAALGNQEIRTSAGAAITLRTFLHEDYKEFHAQVFELAVAYLRFRKADPNIPEPLDSLAQALISLYKEAFPLVRDELKAQNIQFDPQSLNASGIQLDSAYLARADLREAWLLQAFLRKAYLRGASLKDATLIEANLEEANLMEANLEEVNLKEAKLTKANLEGVNFTRAQLEGAKLIEVQLAGGNLQWTHLIKTNLERTHLEGAHLEGARLINALLAGANLEGARLTNATLEGADLKEVNFRGAYLQGVNLRGAKLQGANPETANSLQDADMNGVLGLSQEQRDTCIEKGAIFDDSQ